MKKSFALEQIAPYYKNRNLCGFNGSNCCYYTNGKMCVFGKNLIDPKGTRNIDADQLLEQYGEDILKPESRGILTKEEWKSLQCIHDSIALKDTKIKGYCERLGLFTFQELEEYAETI